MKTEWIWNDTKITITDYGKFVAKIEDEEFVEASMEDMRAKIDSFKQKLAKRGSLAPMHLPVIGLLRAEATQVHKIYRTYQKGINRKTGDPMYADLPKDSYFSDVVADGPGAEEALKRLVQARVDVQAAGKALEAFDYRARASYNMSIESYPQYVAKVIASYQKTLDKLKGEATNA